MNRGKEHGLEYYLFSSERMARDLRKNAAILGLAVFAAVAVGAGTSSLSASLKCQLRLARGR